MLGFPFVTKENQQDFGPQILRSLIVLTLPMDDESGRHTSRPQLGTYRCQRYDIIESGSAFDRFVELNASKKIAESTLYVTAAYEDGTAETKTYRIAPVEDFEERYLAFQELRDECFWKNGKESPRIRPILKPPALTITQLS